jgi:hypothetical protein
MLTRIAREESHLFDYTITSGNIGNRGKAKNVDTQNIIFRRYNIMRKRQLSEPVLIGGCGCE